MLVPLFAEDALLDRGRKLIGDAPITPVVSDFAAAEFASSLGRKVRTGHLIAEHAQMAFVAFDAWVARVATRVVMAPSDVAGAQAWLRRLELNLRAPDAIHIAMAQRLGARIATFDRRMATSARSLGSEVLE